MKPLGAQSFFHSFIGRQAFALHRRDVANQTLEVQTVLATQRTDKLSLLSRLRRCVQKLERKLVPLSVHEFEAEAVERSKYLLVLRKLCAFGHLERGLAREGQCQNIDWRIALFEDGMDALYCRARFP